MRGFAAIALYNPKGDVNVGGAIRAAGCYGARLVVIGGKRSEHMHKRGRIERTDPRSTHKQLPVIWAEDLLSACPHECAPVAVEFIKTSQPLPSFSHPERAFYVFGPEDGSIPKEILDKCATVVHIPTEACMNLAATVNVVLYDRLAKGSE